MAIVIPWSDDPVKNRENIEAAMEAGETEINGEYDESGLLKSYRVDRLPVPPMRPPDEFPSIRCIACGCADKSVEYDRLDSGLEIPLCFDCREANYHHMIGWPLVVSMAHGAD